ncbi:MAG: hypothetical protein U0237_05420 [Thermoleophilia bacterium]
MRIHPEQVLVVHDQRIDLPFGTVRGKSEGGHGSHNGLRSIDQGSGPGRTRGCAWAWAGQAPTSAATRPRGCSQAFSEPRDGVLALLGAALPWWRRP